MSVTISLRGALGNQLFQICALVAYGIKNKKKIYLNESRYFDTDIRHWHFFKHIDFHAKEFIDSIPFYEPNTTIYNEIPVWDNQNIILYGFFFSWKYFWDYKDEIFEKLEINNFRRYIKDTYQYDYDNTVSMHFRLGDYVDINHYILEDEYYINAMKKLIELTGKDDWNILYFYEKRNEQSVNERIEKMKYKNLTFIPIDVNIPACYQMMIMSFCKHNIIANSTFSVWGSYFNNRSDKLVFYPEYYFRFGTYQNMFFNDWIKISSDPQINEISNDVIIKD